MAQDNSIYRWVKVSERLPNHKQIGEEIVFQFHNNRHCEYTWNNTEDDISFMKAACKKWLCKVEEDNQQYKEASETNYKQVMELGVIATDLKAELQEKEKEIERLKGLLGEERTKTSKISNLLWLTYNHPQEKRWNDFAKENNL